MRENTTITQWWQAPVVRRARHLLSPRLWYRYATAAERGLPEFIIAGAQKAGTTSLFDYLAGHPQCAASLAKEVHYFDDHFALGEIWYRMHFPPLSAADSSPSARRQCFESSPYYMFDPRVPARMAAALPRVKVILLVRNPIDRGYSHYQHSVRRGREPLAFEAAIEAEPARLAGEHERLLANGDYSSTSHRRYSYLARGLYADQLLRWQASFPAEQLLVVQAEALFKRPAETFATVLRFLGLNAWMPAQFGKHNPGRYVEPMSPAVRERLREFYAPHNERLFAMLGTRYEWN